MSSEFFANQLLYIFNNADIESWNNIESIWESFLFNFELLLNQAKNISEKFPKKEVMEHVNQKKNSKFN